MRKIKIFSNPDNLFGIKLTKPLIPTKFKHLIYVSNDSITLVPLNVINKFKK